MTTELDRLIRRAIPSTFQDEGDGNYATRDEGDVGEETPGQYDMELARETCKLINADPSLPVRATWETIDEWTTIYIRRDEPADSHHRKEN